MRDAEIKEFRKRHNLTQEDVSKIVGVGVGAVRSWEQGVRNISKSAALVLKKYDQENKTASVVNEPAEKYKLEAVSGVPYYDVEFTSSFLEVENDQTIQPTSYISHPFFTGCDLVVRNSGQSMAKLICHGDAVGLVKINNWKEFFPLGEVYGIVTENNFRMIKIITKGETEDYYTLISKPTDSKKDEFPPQQIKKTSIVAIFKVQACSHLF